MQNHRNREAKEDYKRLRQLSFPELWALVPGLEKAEGRDRAAQAPLIRALGVVGLESGSAEEKESLKKWLLQRLHDPEEKIRRYAMAALPKLGAGEAEEKELLELLQRSREGREIKFVGRALDKIGGASTLEALAGHEGLGLRTEQKARAHVAREESPSSLRLDRSLGSFQGLRIVLRGRKGLEGFVRDEAGEGIRKSALFRLGQVRPGEVELFPLKAFSLGDLYKLRCFGTVHFVLGQVRTKPGTDREAAVASIIVSAAAREIFRAFTEGTPRYRLEFLEEGGRGLAQKVAVKAYALCQEILNDPRQAPWAVEVRKEGQGERVELRPRFSHDPRLVFRKGDVPAASHPPLAACMARLAGPFPGEVAWDPFCGSGLELIERALRGGVKKVIGTDLSPEALEVAGRNFAAADLPRVESEFVQSDFREWAQAWGKNRDREKISLVISNPPMGMRVPIPDLRGLIADFMRCSADVLRPGGRLVFANPLKSLQEDPRLRLLSRQVVDFGGFNARLEKYLRV